jgi:aryl-alcohol dehydrogenase-like predicted oxidoreductase
LRNSEKSKLHPYWVVGRGSGGEREHQCSDYRRETQQSTAIKLKVSSLKKKKSITLASLHLTWWKKRRQITKSIMEAGSTAARRSREGEGVMGIAAHNTSGN